MILRCSLTFVCLVAGLRDVISQHGCCGPQQWTGVAIQKRGRYDHDLDVASLADLNTRIGYDYVNRKISLQQKIYNITVDTQESVHVIYDFKQVSILPIIPLDSFHKYTECFSNLYLKSQYGCICVKKQKGGYQCPLTQFSFTMYPPPPMPTCTATETELQYLDHLG